MGTEPKVNVALCSGNVRMFDWPVFGETPHKIIGIFIVIPAVVVDS